MHSNVFIVMSQPQIEHHFVQVMDFCSFTPQFGWTTLSNKHCESVKIMVSVSDVQGLVQFLHLFPNAQKVLQRCLGQQYKGQEVKDGSIDILVVSQLFHMHPIQHH